MAFIEAVVASSAKNAAWTPLDYTPTIACQVWCCLAEQ